MSKKKTSSKFETRKTLNKGESVSEARARWKEEKERLDKK